MLHSLLLKSNFNFCLTWICYLEGVFEWLYRNTFRSNHTKVFWKKAILAKFAKFTGKDLCRRFGLTKFHKKETCTWVFSCELYEILRLRVIAFVSDINVYLTCILWFLSNVTARDFQILEKLPIVYILTKVPYFHRHLSTPFY